MSNLKNILWNFFMLFVLAILICPLHGCTTTKYVPVKETHTDTIYKARKDSIKWIEKTRLVDSVRWRDSVSTIVDANGKITRIDTWHWRDRTSTSNDSLLFYKSKLDSALQSKADSVPQPYQEQVCRKEVIRMAKNNYENRICRVIGHHPCLSLWECEGMEEIQCGRHPF